ncbi:baseplate assembly protein [Pasteurellaceae bacterium LFhippo2]|nr:baseplate assembly protein [Pasteurellaceae bacterium LFhippo2]
MSEITDLSKLPEPDVLEALDFEEMLKARKSAFIDLYPEDEQAEWVARLALESDPIVKLLEENCYFQLLERQRINSAAQATMLAYATGNDLDVIAANFNVTRLVIQEADDSANPAIEEILEPDDDFRTRVQLKFEALSVAGPRKAYTFQALSAHGKVADVSVESPAPAYVTVTILSRDGKGESSDEILQAVRSALNDEEVRPIADRVTVQGAEIINYQVQARLHLFRGPQSEPIRQTAQKNLDKYTQLTKRLGRDITRSGIYAALHVEGVQNVEIIQPAQDIVLNSAQASYCTGTELTLVVSDEYS